MSGTDVRGDSADATIASLRLRKPRDRSSMNLTTFEGKSVNDIDPLKR